MCKSAETFHCGLCHLSFRPRAEANVFQDQLAKEVDTSETPVEKQTKCCVFSLHARKNMIYWRAILMESPTAHLHMEDSRWASRNQGGSYCTLFTDASGKPMHITEPGWRPTCLGVYRPQSAHTPVPELRAFVLPYHFLTGHDQQGPVFNNTTSKTVLPRHFIIISDF